MLQRNMSYINKALTLMALLCIAVLAASCSKGGESSSSSSTGGAEFEGIIAMKMEGENQKGGEMTYFLKGRNTRIETKMGNTPEGMAVMLWDPEGGKVTTLMPSRKMYMTMDLKATGEGFKEAANDMKQSQGYTQDRAWPKLTPTGKKETVAGHTCEHWLMGDKQDLDMCVAKGLGYFGMGSQLGGGGLLKDLAFSPKIVAEAAAHPEWVKFLEGGAFPLKLTMTEDGKVKMNMEATRIEKKSLDDSLFTIPSDFKELSIPALTGGKR